MNREELTQKVKAITASKLCVGIDKITASSTFVDLGCDSLDVVELLMAYESAFNVKISDVEARPIKTFEELISLISSKMGIGTDPENEEKIIDDFDDLDDSDDMDDIDNIDAPSNESGKCYKMKLKR